MSPTSRGSASPGQPHALRATVSPTFAAGAGPVLVALHGYGADENDLVGVADEVMRGGRWVSLRAPIALPNGGAAWFPIGRPGDPDAAPAEAATATIWAWIDSNLPAGTAVIPFGFSQGGLMATQLLRTRPERVVSPIVLGGFTLRAPQPGDGALVQTRPRLFWGRGEDDAVITPDAVLRTDAWVARHVNASNHVYVGLGHGISTSELRDVRAFISAS